MTNRIRAVLEAADKATPGPWDAVHVNDKGLWCICKAVNGVVISPSTDNASLIAAAPDMAAEIVKLRKWQSEAVEWVQQAAANRSSLIKTWRELKLTKLIPDIEKDIIDIDRLIAEAKEATND